MMRLSPSLEQAVAGYRGDRVSPAFQKRPMLDTIDKDTLCKSRTDPEYIIFKRFQLQSLTRKLVAFPAHLFEKSQSFLDGPSGSG